MTAGAGAGGTVTFTEVPAPGTVAALTGIQRTGPVEVQANGLPRRAGDDRVDGDGGSDCVATQGGDDVITATGGDDKIDCDTGVDAAKAGRGDNTNVGTRCETFSR